MQAFTKVDGVVTPLNRADVDTDQIIPKQFLKRVERTGFGQFLFYDWRYKSDGKTPNPSFELNQPRYKNAAVLLTRDNFGCGSSREHAPWALQDWGYRAVIAPSYADIFRSNCAKVGLLCVVLPAADVAELLAAVPADATIDLERETVTLPSGREVPFETDPTTRRNLLNGWDEIALTFNREDEIAAYERTRERKGPDAVALGA